MLPPNNHEDKSASPPRLEDAEWADRSLRELVAGCTLNIKLVKAGLWPTLLCDMKTVGELGSYATFIEGLGYSLKRAKEALLNRGH